jgi:hypothetical protein
MEGLTAELPSLVTIFANCRVNPSRYIAMKEIIMPKRMYGRRRPKRESQRSERTPNVHVSRDSKYSVRFCYIPTSGCTIKPERGPARKTIDMKLLERPSDTKYGDAKRRKNYN